MKKSNNTTIDKNHVIKQTCGNTRCINPSHLITKTKKEHHQDNIDSYSAVNEKQSKKWTINGVEYSGLRNASKETGLTQGNIIKFTVDGIFDIDAYHENCKKWKVTPKV